MGIYYEYILSMTSQVFYIRKFITAIIYAEEYITIIIKCSKRKMKYSLILISVLFINALANESKRLGLDKEHPASSCNEIYQHNPSSRGTIGKFWVKTDEGLFEVKCNMQLRCSGIEGGWMQVVDVDMNQDDTCPGGWHKIEDPRRLCIGDKGCIPAQFCVNGYSYQHICGQAKGYQKGTPDAFHPGGRSINDIYVDGISIALTSPRTHVWTYAAGYSNGHHHRYSSYMCPCAAIPGYGPPSFVGNDYYCESGSACGPNQNTFYLNDPLWDGHGCGYSIGCCAEIGKPWFYKRLPLSETKEIEVNICLDEEPAKENIAIEKLEIFVM